MALQNYVHFRALVWFSDLNNIYNIASQCAVEVINPYKIKEIVCKNLKIAVFKKADTILINLKS